MEQSEIDYQMKYIGEEQRHRDTREELERFIRRAATWEAAYWALVKAVDAQYEHK
jgi:hypothetical protein